jgi:hypothetical protein
MGWMVDSLELGTDELAGIVQDAYKLFPLGNPALGAPWTTVYSALFPYAVGE